MRYYLKQNPHPSMGYTISRVHDGVSFGVELFRYERNGTRTSLLPQDAETEEIGEKIAALLNDEQQEIP